MRTFAMRLVSVGYAAIVAVFAVYATQPFAADFIALIVALVVVFALLGIAATVWAGARTRPWFWLVATIPGILVLLFNVFYASYALAHPADALSFVTTLVVLVAGLVVIVGSLTAWQEVRRGRPSWASNGRAGVVAVGIVGLVAGACLTSALAATATSAGTALDQPPASTATLTAKDTTFVETGLTSTSGQVLGLYVTNRDAYAHAFDVDSLGIHVPLPPASTTFVAVRPTAAGTLEFYCAVPGHREAGMVGSIAVK